MAKRKNGSTATIQHTSTSEAVKTRPRKRTRITTLPAVGVDTLPKKPPKVEAKQVHVRSSQPIALVHLDELAKIWDNDKRIPTVGSRRAWALARNVKPDHVHRWWARRKQIAKKARQTIPKGTYDLPVGMPPVVKNEATPPPPFPPTKIEDDDATPASSDTLVASSPGPQKKFDSPLTSPISAAPQSPLPPSSPPLASSPAQVPDPFVPLLRLPSLGLALSTIPVSSHVWCTQGRTDALGRSPSSLSFTCALCITDPAANSTVPEADLPRRPTVVPSAHDPENVLSDDYMRLSMDLSALPFLLRSPPDLLHVRVPPPPPIERWCLNKKSYAFDGSFVGPCVCAFRRGSSCGGTTLGI